MTKSARPNFISLLIVCLGVFGGLKLLGVYFDFSGAQAQLPAEAAAVSAGAQNRPVGGVHPPAEIAPGEVERRILERLAERRALLEAREEKIVLRETIIAAAEAKLQTRFATLAQERDEILALREARAEADTEEIEAIVSAYEKMKARDAAAIFNELDTDIMLKVSSRMRTQALAGVLAEMAPARARALTVMLADRDTAPENDAAAQ